MNDVDHVPVRVQLAAKNHNPFSIDVERLVVPRDLRVNELYEPMLFQWLPSTPEMHLRYLAAGPAARDQGALLW